MINQKISKRKIEKKLKRKTNPELRNLIIKLKKQKGSTWISLANVLSNSRRKKVTLNLELIYKMSKPNDCVIIPGKVLSVGEIKHKLKIGAFGFSREALNKLKKEKVEIKTIEELLKENPKGDGIKILM